MKSLIFVLGAVLAWGAYVPTIHAGQMALQKGSLRAFLCVGGAYFLTAVLLPTILLLGPKMEPLEFNGRGVSISTLAGIFGAIGALCVILALKNGGSPTFVAPLVFAGAPLVNVIISMVIHKPKTMPSMWFYVGIAALALGAGLVLRFKPA